MGRPHFPWSGLFPSAVALIKSIISDVWHSSRKKKNLPIRTPASCLRTHSVRCSSLALTRVESEVLSKKKKKTSENSNEATEVVETDSIFLTEVGCHCARVDGSRWLKTAADIGRGSG